MVEAEEGQTLDAVSRSPRFVLRGLDPEVAVPGLRLFQGEVSAYAAKRLRKNEVIAALEKRDVPLSVWTELDGVVVAPARLLQGGETYALALLGQGVLATVAVAEEELPVLERLWPPVMHPQGEAVYCLLTLDSASLKSDDSGPVGDTQEGNASLAVELPPWRSPALVQRGVGEQRLSADRCVSFVPREDLIGDFWVPPSAWAGALFDPAPVPLLAMTDSASEVRVAVGGDGDERSLQPSAKETRAPCAEGELDLAGGCGQFDGGELRVTVPQESAWFLRARRIEGQEVRDEYRTASAAGSVSFPSFVPQSEYELLVERLDPGGLRRSALVQGKTGAPRARLVINEVLADALGPEPQSEWVELYNAGTASASLEGWTLEDGGGRTALPAVEIPAGRFALIVGRDFSAAEDVVPRADTLPVIVERVGDRGLSNGGEPLRLVDHAGKVVSSVPAMASSKPGHSVARLDPWAPDTKESFARHGPPGASPGGPNTFP